jgi:dimethylamine monooxygenase subunit A
MQFDFASIPVPFRMQPGLRRLQGDAPQLTPLAPGGVLHAEKLRVLQAGQSRLKVSGFDEQPALRAVAAHARAHGLVQPSDELPLELAYEEDFAVLDAAGTLPWLCVCVPSHWAPEDKLGLPFAAVHAPVADSQAVLAASQHLVQLATGGECWERSVWTITPSPCYDQHPHRHARAPWPAGAPSADAFAAQCWLRAERQTFLPVPGAGQAVFTIRVMLQPLPEAVDAAAKARRLHDALASMSDAVLAYKNLAAAREPLLRWLQHRSR